MIRTSIDYRVQIVEEPFTTPEGNQYSRFALVEKWVRNSKLSSQKLGVPSKEDIYQKIDANDKIDLRHCYLKNFSISDYRNSRSLKEDQYVPIDSFDASNSFFETDNETDFSYARFTGDLANFKHSTFYLGKINFEFANCESQLDFSHSLFHAEEITFRFAEFDHGNVDFSDCIIDCLELIFVNTNFGEGNVSFRQTQFEQTDCNFQYARFSKGNICFDRSIFYGNEIDFRKIEFGEGRVDFRRVHFGDGNVNFSESEFQEGRINFRSSVFGNGEKLFEKVNFGEGNISFDSTTFGTGLLSFNSSHLHTLSLVNARLGGHCDFKVAEGKSIDLSYSIVSDILDFQSGEHEVKLDSLKIVGLKLMGKIFISWQKNNTYNLISSQKGSSFESKAEQFNLLKESFRTNGNYDAEDYAYVAFKRNAMKAKLVNSRKSGGLKSIVSYFQYYGQWLVFDKAGLFATSPIRVFTSMVIVLTLFSLIYILLPGLTHAEIVSSVGDPDHLNLIQKSFYHSAITFFTIGYGDFYPSGHVRWLSAVEGWAGVFLMSYFTVAFVRKILR